MRITALSPQPRHPQRVHILVDGELRLTVAADVARDLALHVGDDIDEGVLERAAAADERWRAHEAAVALLSYRARTAAELRRRLLRKQFSAPVVDELIVELVSRGYVDDAAFAHAFVRDRLGHRPRGRGRLVQELRARGVAAQEAAEAVAAVFGEDSVAERELARAAAETWARKGGAGKRGPEARRRLYAFLARRGFLGEVARSAVEAVLGDD